MPNNQKIVFKSKSKVFQNLNMKSSMNYRLQEDLWLWIMNYVAYLVQWDSLLYSFCSEFLKPRPLLSFAAAAAAAGREEYKEKGRNAITELGGGGYTYT